MKYNLAFYRKHKVTKNGKCDSCGQERIVDKFSQILNPLFIIWICTECQK